MKWFWVTVIVLQPGATSCNRNVSSLTEWVLASTCSRQSEVCTKDVWCERLLSRDGATQDQGMDITCLKWTLVLPWWRDPRSGHGCYLSDVNACSPVTARAKIRAWMLLVWSEHLLSLDGATQDQGMDVTCLKWTLALPWWRDPRSGHGCYLSDVKACSPVMARPKIRACMSWVPEIFTKTMDIRILCTK